jgi:hypothetical protein
MEESRIVLLQVTWACFVGLSIFVQQATFTSLVNLQVALAPEVHRAAEAMRLSVSAINYRAGEYSSSHPLLEPSLCV